MFGRNTSTSQPNGNGLQNPISVANQHGSQPADHKAIYGNGASSGTGPGTMTSPAHVPQNSGMQPASSAQSTMSSVISNDLTIIGQSITIVSQGHVQIDGAVQGNVHGKEVSIGPRGAITGMVMAENVEVHGQLQGSIRSPAVTLHPTARVEGDIHHLKLAISEGAEFDGRVRRPKDAAELQPILDPAKLAAESGMPTPTSPAEHSSSQSASPHPPAQTPPPQPALSVPTPSSPPAVSPLAAAGGNSKI